MYTVGGRLKNHANAKFTVKFLHLTINSGMIIVIILDVIQVCDMYFAVMLNLNCLSRVNAMIWVNAIHGIFSRNH